MPTGWKNSCDCLKLRQNWLKRRQVRKMQWNEIGAVKRSKSQASDSETKNKKHPSLPAVTMICLLIYHHLYRHHYLYFLSLLMINDKFSLSLLLLLLFGDLFYFILFFFGGVQRLYNVSILFSAWQSTPLAGSPPSSSVAFSNILESQEQENTNLNRYVRLFTVITYIQQNHISLCECWMVSHLLLWCSYWPICSIFFGFII